MSREIKFRAWSNKWNKMCHHCVSGCEIYVHSNSIWFEGCDDECAVLEQYTGLKDKNGVEIYEGDIVKQRKEIDGNFVSFRIETFLVAWRLYGFAFVPIEDKHLKQWSAMPHEDVEIIGNIHKNAYLINTTAP